MSNKYSFAVESQDKKRDLPRSVIIGRKDNETVVHVLLKALGFILFFRERLRLDARVPDDAISFVPDLSQLDYELRVKLWVECGECSINKLDKLAVKCPEAELWVITQSLMVAEDVIRLCAKHDLRKGRYNVLALDGEMFEELLGLTQNRNAVTWFGADFDEGTMQFDYAGLWFDTTFKVLKH
jgi:uncharacterized protein YaeQ